MTPATATTAVTLTVRLARGIGNGTRSAANGKHGRCWSTSSSKRSSNPSSFTRRRNNFRSFFTTSNDPSRKARVAVIGTGRMGAIRSSIVQGNPRLDFAGVIDTDLEAATALADQYGVHAFHNLEQAIAAPGGDPLDGIIVSSPTHTHGDIIQQACIFGLQGVFVEQPVGSDAAEIAALFGMADAANLELCCGFPRRFDPRYVAAAQAVASGSIGNPVTAKLFFADHPTPSRDFLLTSDGGGGGGDIFLDLCAHDVDYITHALDDTVKSVHATGTSSDDELKAAGIHDNVVLVLHMEETGAVVTLSMSRSANNYGYDHRCEIFGDKGLVNVENQPETTATLSDEKGVQLTPQRFEKAFALELDAFAGVLLEDDDAAAWPISGEQCIHVQKVADAARLSCAEGRLVEVEY